MKLAIMLLVTEVFTIIFQRIFCENTLTSRGIKKKTELLIWTIYFILTNAVTYTLTGLLHIGWINFVPFIGLLFIVLKILYINQGRTLLTVAVFMYLSGFCSELIVVFGIELLPWFFDGSAELFWVILSKLIWFFIIKLVSLLVRMKKREELNIQDWLEMFIVPVGSIWILFVLFYQREVVDDLFSFIAVMMVLAIDIFTYYLYENAKETMENRWKQELLLQQYDYYVRQSKESAEWWEALRQFRHDMKQRYLLEKTYVEARDYAALEKYCNDNLNFLNRMNNVSNTGNVYVDGIINYKADMAKRLGIEVAVNLIVPRDSEMNAEDFTICLGNLLDNAIEAVKDLPDNRIVYVRINADKNNLLINVKNKYGGTLCKVGERYLTGKKDLVKHGWGLLSVKQIVKKYDGEFSISDENGEFDVVVLLFDFLK